MPASPQTHHCNNILRHLLIIVLILDIQNAISEEYHFVRGADISWCTEMEADGMRFYNNTGEETDIFTLMKQIGLNTIRLRVWVNPETGYGAWCDKADVLTKAQRAHNQGLDLLLDFHYSDYFADPGRQSKPSAWEVLNFNELKAAVSNHTTDILQALKQEGIEPIWVQIGNETNSGILWEDGKIDWAKSGEERLQNYITLSNACYDAVKAVLPNTIVIIHHDNAKDDNTWFYQDYKQYGGKFDIIGLSHYPDWEEWREDNTKATNNIRKLHDTLQVPVMIVETGYSNWDEERAMQVIQDLYNKASRETGCCGILYWEPEVYGG